MAAGFEVGDGVVRSWVLVPMSAKLAEGARESRVLDTKIWPPGGRVWPAITNSEAALAVYVAPANFITAGYVIGGGVESTWVVPPTRATSAEGYSDTGVLATFITPP